MGGAADGRLYGQPMAESGLDAAFIERFSIEPAAAAMFEDAPRNLVVPRALGMRTVLVTGQKAPRPIAPAADFVISDLPGFLSNIADALSG